MGFRVDTEKFRAVIHNANRKLSAQYPNCPTELKMKLWEEHFNIKLVPHNDGESLYDSSVDIDMIFPTENDYLTFLITHA